MGLSDEMLALETLKGDSRAFEELVLRYQKLVFQLAYRMVSREEAEDIAQEVFITIYQKMHQFNPSKKFSSWLYRITVNTCISYLRRKKKVVLLSFDETVTRQIDALHDASIDPLYRLEIEDLRNKIATALLRMPEGYRAMIILRYQLDLTNQEIAEAMEISKENVEVRMHRARKMLRSILLENSEGRIENELQSGK